MENRFKVFFNPLLLVLLFSYAAHGQNPSNSGGVPALMSPISGFVTEDRFALFYQIDPKLGVLTLSLRDGNFDQMFFEEYRIGRGFSEVSYDVVAEKVYLLLSNWNSFKMIGVIDTSTRDAKFYPISVNLGRVDRFKAIGNAILVVESLEKGDFVQLYDFRSGILISIPELYYPKGRVQDVQAKDDVFDILLHKKGNHIKQSLKMFGYTSSGTKVYDTEMLLPGPNKLIFKSARLINTRQFPYKIVGTYANKKGEQFSGYYHITIDDYLQQEAKIHPMRSLEGFFDYKKNPGLRKNAKNLRREMVVYHSVAEGNRIAMASSSDLVARKFVHFLLLDEYGDRVFDTSVKVFYSWGNYMKTYSRLALFDNGLYFVFEGHQKINVPPGMKLYKIDNGELTGLLRIDELIQKQDHLEGYEVSNVFYWKESTFIVLLVDPTDGTLRQEILKFEI